MNTSSPIGRLLAVIAATAAFVSAEPGHAASASWNINYAGAGVASPYDWFGTASPTYWIGGTAPNGTDDVASFIGNFTTTMAVTIGGTNLTLGGLEYRDTVAVDRDFTLAGTGTLTMATTTGTPEITAYSRSLNVNVALAGTQGISFGSGTASSVAGTVVLNAVNTYTGGTTIVAGVLAPRVTNAFVTSEPLTINGGSLSLHANSQNVGTLTMVSGSIILASPTDTAVITATSYDLRSGQSDASFNGSGATTKSTSGTVTITAKNTAYSGSVAVNAGTLLLSGTGSLGAGTITLGGGTLDISALTAGSYAFANTLSGSGTIADGSKTAILSGAVDPGAAGLTFSGGTVQVGSAATFQFTLGTASDAIRLTNSGALDLGSGLLNFNSFSFSTGSGFGQGTYTLISGASSLAGSLGSGLSGTVGGFNATLALSGDDLILNVASIPEPGSLTLCGFGLILAIQAASMRRHVRARD